MKILVTGGAGFIGSNVVDAYIQAGHKIVIVDNLYSGKMENINSDAKFYLMDIRAKELKKVIEIEKPDIINHHAAQISVPYSVENPSFDASVNIQGMINLLECARETGVKKIIFISSGGAVYGEAEEYPTTETYPPQPLSPYAIAKAVCEQYLAFYNHQYGLNYTVLRYANVYGPRQIPQAEAGVVSIFMDNLLNARPCTIYHYPEDTDGMIRDYCFVGDIVEANISALTGGDCQIVNIGTGKETKTRQLFNTVFEVISRHIPDLDPALANPKLAPARAGDIKRSCLNVTKAKKVLGWEAHTSLEDGISRTLSWKKQMN